jgi:hypothetical protein
MTAFGNWRFTVDRNATVVAYSRAPRGGSEDCSCSGCRNFVAARDRIYPPEFLALLDSLGIDRRKDGEVYQMTRRAPGCHDYGGWFHFVGMLENTEDFPGVAMSDHFMARLRTNSAPELAALRGLPLVELEFHSTNVPWVLSEQEPP